jgi:hypothetical protein
MILFFSKRTLENKKSKRVGRQRQNLSKTAILAPNQAILWTFCKI